MATFAPPSWGVLKKMGGLWLHIPCLLVSLKQVGELWIIIVVIVVNTVIVIIIVYHSHY